MRHAGSMNDGIDPADEILGSERTRHVAERNALDARVVEHDGLAGGGTHLISRLRQAHERDAGR